MFVFTCLCMCCSINLGNICGGTVPSSSTPTQKSSSYSSSISPRLTSASKSSSTGGYSASSAKFTTWPAATTKGTCGRRRGACTGLPRGRGSTSCACIVLPIVGFLVFYSRLGPTCLWPVIVAARGIGGEAKEWLQPSGHINGFLQSTGDISEAGSS